MPSGDCFNIPVPITEPATQGRCRFVYGYGGDGSDFPCYLLWPFRSSEGRFWLVDSLTSRYFDPEAAAYMGPIGLEHFFDAFSLTVKRDFRGAAAVALDIPLHEIQPNLTVKQPIAGRFNLTPIRAPEAPPAKRVKRSKEARTLDQDAAMDSEGVKVEADSSAASASSSSACDSDMSSEDGSSEESDLDKFEEALKSLGSCPVAFLNEDVPGISLDGGFDTLQTLANVPKTWLLARLTFPLSGFSKQLERLLEGYCLEVLATNSYPDQHCGAVKQFAKDLVLLLAMHLSERIASLLRKVLEHPTKVLHDPETELLFLPQFWILPIYRELLNTASRCRPSRASELSRAATWRIIPVSKWLITMVSKSPKLGLFPL